MLCVDTKDRDHWTLVSVSCYCIHFGVCCVNIKEETGLVVLRHGVLAGQGGSRVRGLCSLIGHW